MTPFEARSALETPGVPTETAGAPRGVASSTPTNPEFTSPHPSRVDLAEDGSPSTVVLIPGTLCDERVFEPLVETLKTTRPTEVVSIFGSSSIEAMTDKISQITPDTFVAVGLSLGAVVATYMALTMPHRISRLVLMDTNLAAATPPQIRERQDWSRLALEGHLESVVRTELLPLMTYRRHDLDELVLSMAMRAGTQVFVEQNSAIVGRPDLRPHVNKLDIPVLVLFGEFDLLCSPASHRELSGQIEKSEVCMVPKAGHLSILDRPDYVSHQILNWLSSTN